MLPSLLWICLMDFSSRIISSLLIAVYVSCMLPSCPLGTCWSAGCHRKLILPLNPRSLRFPTLWVAYMPYKSVWVRGLGEHLLEILLKSVAHLPQVDLALHFGLLFGHHLRTGSSYLQHSPTEPFLGLLLHHFEEAESLFVQSRRLSLLDLRT